MHSGRPRSSLDARRLLVLTSLTWSGNVAPAQGASSYALAIAPSLGILGALLLVGALDLRELGATAET